jgi:hypothetical protein
VSLVIRIGLFLSAAIVLTGLAWAVFVGFKSGAGDGLQAVLGVAFGGAMALALIWLGVFVVYVVLKAIRVVREL